MPPFRPANLNKRAYPGNASVIGPTLTATLGFTTTTCCSSTICCGACNEQNVLGCRFTFCACPCCNVCCSCSQTLCDRTIPSGKWKASEQYEARSRNAWGDDTCSCGAASCLCSTANGCVCVGVTQITDCKGFFICCGPSTCKWFVAPACTQVSANWYSTGNAVTCANSLMGSCGWFVPDIGVMSDPGYNCRTYWDSYCLTSYWSSSETNAGRAPCINMTNGVTCSHFTPHAPSGKQSGGCVRAFRCTAS